MVFTFNYSRIIVKVYCNSTYILYMKVSSKQKIRMYSHHEHDLDVEEAFWPIMGTLLSILGVWTGVIHLIDYLTLDSIPWWIEPFTIVPVIFLLIMKEKFDSLNPLYEPTKGFLVDLTPGQLKPKRGQPALSQQAENILGATDNPNIIAEDASRKAVRDWVQNQLTKYPGIRVFDPNAANVTKTDDLLKLRSEIRSEQRAQSQAGNLDRSDLLGSVEAEVTQVIDAALPRDLQLQLRETDGL